MVYRGPSSGCKTCRRRKIKCDENDPCGRCIRLGVACPGVPKKQSQILRTSLDQQSSRTATTSTDTQPDQIWQTIEGSSAERELGENKDGRMMRVQPARATSRLRAQANDASEDWDEMLMLRPHPTISWKDVGVAKFLSFIRSDHGDTDPWSTMLVDSSSRVDRECAYFDDALAAVSLQRLGKEPNLDALQRQAAVFHGKALRHFSKALQNSAQASSDKSLISVRLLIIYGFNAMHPGGPQSAIGLGDPSQDGPAEIIHSLPTPTTSRRGSLETESIGLTTPPPSQHNSSVYTDPDPIIHSDPAAAAIAAHFDGLLYMLLIRGPKQLETNSTCTLYHSIRDRIVCNYSKRCKVLPVSRDQPQWHWFFDSPTISPANALTNIAIDVPNLRYRAAALYRRGDTSPHYQHTQALRNEAYSLISRMQAWHTELPTQWREPRIAQIDSRQHELGVGCEYQGLGHAYPNPFIAMVIGRYEAYKILLLQVIATSIKAELKFSAWAGPDSQICPARFLEEEYESATANQRTFVDDICAIVAVYNLKDEKIYELGQEIPPCGMQYGGHLIEPLLISRTVPCVPPHQMKFLGLKMKEFLGR